MRILTETDDGGASCSKFLGIEPGTAWRIQNGHPTDITQQRKNAGRRSVR